MSRRDAGSVETGPVVRAPGAHPVGSWADAMGAAVSFASSRPSARRPGPSAGLPRRSRDALLAAARNGLAEAAAARVPGERYALAHLAALRAAAAVLADRARPEPGHRGRPASAWRLLVAVAPEFAEWAAFFAAGAGKRSAAEAGLPVVSAREADDLIRDAGAFLAVAETTLGVAGQPGPLPPGVGGEQPSARGP